MRINFAKYRTARQSDRRERAGWIVLNGNGTYSFVTATIISNTPCSARFDLTPPPGAVQWAHSHPFRRGEVITACGFPSGSYYPGGGSPADQATSDLLGGMHGYAIDPQGIYEFGGTQYTIQRNWIRCGY